MTVVLKIFSISSVKPLYIQLTYLQHLSNLSLSLGKTIILISRLPLLYTLKEETFAEETFASGKIRETFGRNLREFRELANFGFFARITFREFML